MHVLQHLYDIMQYPTTWQAEVNGKWYPRDEAIKLILEKELAEVGELPIRPGRISGGESHP